MAKRDFYEILGISRDATSKEIKQAYRRLAMELHPDRNPDDPEAEERFKEAAEAYEVLSNPEKREIYDRFGYEGLRGQTGFSGVEDIFTSFGDIFSEFFGGDIFGSRYRYRSRPPRPIRGADLRYDLKLSFEESMAGTRKEIKLTHLRRCQKCDGTGAALGTQPEACGKCKGQGQVIQRTGFMTLSMTCPACNGSGTWIPKPCDQCEGTGRAPFTRSVTASVPAGIGSGMRLRLAGEGEHPESGGEPGDLYVFVEVEPHRRFERDGDDLICHVTVPYTQAILGHVIEIEILKDRIPIELPPGTQPGEKIRVRGKGVPHVGRSGAGDLVVEVKVALPTNISSQEKELLKELGNLGEEKIN
jgi:molecular chaperone DnaJ